LSNEFESKIMKEVANKVLEYVLDDSVDLEDFESKIINEILDLDLKDLSLEI